MRAQMRSRSWGDDEGAQVLQKRKRGGLNEGHTVLYL